MRYLDQALIFLVGTVIGTYILLVLLRFLFQLTRTDFYNPMAQFIVRASNPLILPLRRLIPGFGGIDWASVVVMAFLGMAKIYLTRAILGLVPTPQGAAILALAELLELTLYIFLIAVFVRAALSWINPHGQNPMSEMLISLTEPLLAPARRLIPALSGMDLSPIAVVVLLELALILLVQPLLDLGHSLLFH